ncbi:MAG: hypothetical protein JXA28_07890 [Bacteroidetes bacterium]|nr:hypothetical protein [Bacteroidota bacterium]
MSGVFHVLPFFLLLLLFAVCRTSAQPLICYFGDSITEGWIEGERLPTAAYPEQTDLLLQLNGSTSRSLPRGFGGETTDDALRRIDTDVLVHRPDIVVIAFGSNDRYVWGDPPAPRVPLQRFRENLRLLLQKVRGLGAHPVLLGLPPLLENRFYRAGVDSTVYAPYGGAATLHRHYDDVIMDMGREETVAVVNVREAFADDSALLGFDGVHPMPDGHARIASALAPVLQDLLRQPASGHPPADPELWPNPFLRSRSSYCTLRFHVAAPQRVLLSVHDSGGREVREIVYYAHAIGIHVLPWDGRDRNGTPVASGAYTLYVHAETFSHSLEILLM